MSPNGDTKFNDTYSLIMKQASVQKLHKNSTKMIEQNIYTKLFFNLTDAKAMIQFF